MFARNKETKYLHFRGQMQGLFCCLWTDQSPVQEKNPLNKLTNLNTLQQQKIGNCTICEIS